MRHNFRIWFVYVVLLSVGGSYSASLPIANADPATNTVNPVGAESISDLLQEGSDLEEQIYTLLRGLKFPHTIGTADVHDAKAKANPKIIAEIELLHEQVEQWKQKAVDFLFNSDDAMLRVNSVLPVLYFGLATKILQTRILTGTYSDTDEIASMRVPIALAWAAGKAFQDMLTKQLQLEWHADHALISLRAEFTTDTRVGMTALNPSDAAHLQATKHILYRTLYAPLLRNEYYRGEEISLPDKMTKNLPDRLLLLAERRGSYSQAQLVASLHSVAPRLNMPADGLDKPLHADKNWALVSQLRRDFPHFQTFVNNTLAAQLYPLIPEEQRERLEINSQEDFKKFLTLGECLLFPNILSSAVKKLGFVVDGSEAANEALARTIRNAKLSATISVLRQLRIQNRTTIETMNKVILQRRDEIKIDGGAWYQAAVMFLPILKERVRNNFTNDLIATAKQIHTIEELALKPVALAVLNKSLWRTFHVDDFSGEFQSAIAGISQSKSYTGARKVYFKQLSGFLQRLQAHPVNETTLAKMSIDDIQTKYLLLETSSADDDNHANNGISDKAHIHHISQAKALLRYGEWFGFFSNLTTTPRIDDLPLTKAQKENYFLELKYALIDRYPLLLLEHDKKPLHELLATVEPEQESAQWSLISGILERQQHMIVKTIKKVDKANSASDLKYLLAHSYPISSAMQEYAGLYPIHQDKAEKFGKPSKFWKDLEALDHKYVGAFFMFLISLHLGEWIMGKHPSTRKMLRYTTAMMKPNMYVVGYLATLLFAGIILEWVAIETIKVFVLAPHKVNTLYDYYEIGSGNDQFLSRTLLDYIELEQKAEKLNYGFEGAMHSIFVGWFGYQAIIKRMLNRTITADKTKKLLQRIGFAETHQEVAVIFDTSMMHARSEAQISSFQNKIKDGVISEIYGKQQIRQVELARKNLEKRIAKITRNIEKIRLQHGDSLQKDQTLSALFNRPISISKEVPLHTQLLNYDEAIAFSLLRKRPTAGKSDELQVALESFGLPANFFEATKPENLERIVIERYRIKIDTFKGFKEDVKNQYLGILSRHKAVLDNEITLIKKRIGK